MGISIYCARIVPNGATGRATNASVEPPCFRELLLQFTSAGDNGCIPLRAAQGGTGRHRAAQGCPHNTTSTMREQPQQLLLCDARPYHVMT